jgi:hypothetical protein
MDGQGILAEEYTYPPLWVPIPIITVLDFRISRFAGYVKYNMP